MQEINFTQEQKTKLESLHNQTRDSRSCDRIKAVLLRSENWSTPMISQALRLHETTIVRHITIILKKRN